MIYHFKITSPEMKNFLLEVEADAGHSFFELHTTIQKTIDFESYQLASFFIPDQNGRKQKEISTLDLGLNGGAYFIMQKTKLSDLIEPKTQQLIYSFDAVFTESIMNFHPGRMGFWIFRVSTLGVGQDGQRKFVSRGIDFQKAGVQLPHFLVQQIITTNHRLTNFEINLFFGNQLF